MDVKSVKMGAVPIYAVPIYATKWALSLFIHDDEGIGDVYDAVRDGRWDYVAVLELERVRGDLVCGDPHGKEGIGHVHGAVGIDVSVHEVEV